MLLAMLKATKITLVQMSIIVELITCYPCLIKKFGKFLRETIRIKPCINSSLLDLAHAFIIGMV